MLGHDDVEVIYAGRLHRGRIGLCKDQRYVDFKRGVPFRVSRELADVLRKKPEWVVGAQPFARFHEEHGHGFLLVRRFGALGDLIMLRAVMGAMRKAFPMFFYGLQCQPRHVGIFKHDPLWLEVVGDNTRARHDYLGELYMDGVVEVDHTGEEESRTHRVNLFWRHLVKDFEQNIVRELDWDIPLGADSYEFAETWLAERGLMREQRVRPLVALQVKGSGPVKTLPLPEIKNLLNMLVQRDFDVILIDQQSHPELLTERGRIFEVPGRTVLEVTALMKYLDTVLCMDSGVLWLAHIAKVPTLLFLGPTRPEERISMHPLYEEGLAAAVRMNEYVTVPPRKTPGCQSCFENAKECGYKYLCMNSVPVSRLEDEIFTLLDRFTGPRRGGYERRCLREVPEV